MVQHTRNRAARRLGHPRTALAGATALLLAAVLGTGAAPGDPVAGPSGPATAPNGPADAAEPTGDQDPLPAPQSGMTTDAVEPESCYDHELTESLAPSDEAGEAVQRVQEAGQLVVGVDQNSYLWGFRDPATNALSGFDIDLVHAIAEDLLGEDPEIVFRAVPTAELIPMVQDGDLDLGVRTVSMTCERHRQVAFSAPYFETGQQLLAPRGSDIQEADWGQLRDKRVCVGEGTTAEELVDGRNTIYRPPEKIVAGDHLDCLVLVQRGRADALITDGALAAGHAAQDPGVQLVGEPLTAEPYGVAMNQDDEDLVRRVNAVLADYTDGGAESAWRQAYDRWLAEHMETAPPSPPDPLYGD